MYEGLDIKCLFDFQKGTDLLLHTIWYRFRFSEIIFFHSTWTSDIL